MFLSDRHPNVGDHSQSLIIVWWLLPEGNPEQSPSCKFSSFKEFNSLY